MDVQLQGANFTEAFLDEVLNLPAHTTGRQTAISALACTPFGCMAASRPSFRAWSENRRAIAVWMPWRNLHVDATACAVSVCRRESGKRRPDGRNACQVKLRGVQSGQRTAGFCGRTSRSFHPVSARPRRLRLRSLAGRHPLCCAALRCAALRLSPLRALVRLRTLAAKSSLGSQDANFTNADCTDANFQKVSAFGVNFYAGTAVCSNKPGWRLQQQAGTGV
jgi:uncharacterized protein YjbI with pentapeptide repeats